MDRYSYSYTSKSRIVPQPSKTYPKLLPLLLKKLSYNTLSHSFKNISHHARDRHKKISRLTRIASINIQMSLAYGWKQLKMYGVVGKYQGKLLRDVFVLAKRLQLERIREGFGGIRAMARIAGSSSFMKISHAKKTMLGQCLKKLFYNTKKNAYTKLKSNTYTSKLHSRLLTIHTISKGSQKRLLLHAWHRLLTITSTKLALQKTIEMQDLSCQLQDMRMQVENKNANISRLQEEISELKQNSIINNSRPNDTSSFMFNNSFGNRSASQLARSRTRMGSNNFDKESNDGSVVRDASFGSLLGHSILSYRSRGSNAGNKEDQCACTTCGYRERYEKHKATNQTLKKQLEIIKTQLEFTKDMNQHMQNQIKSHFTNEEKQKKLQKMRNDLKESQKDRQVLRDKVIKYEKYVSKLKLEFKAKIEEIYRRVKKNGM